MPVRLLAGAAILASAAAVGAVAALLARPAVQPAAATVQPAAATVEAAAPRQVAAPKDSEFWGLVEETRQAAGNDTGRQSELLKDRLTRLSPDSILAFARTREQLDRQLYTWRMWGAATTIEDGCSEDCFRDFRGYVISLGRGPYERALADPDSLATVAQNAEAGDWENADNVAPDAYSSATGHDFPGDDADLSGRPAGEAVDFSGDALRRRYPRLAARFR
jgi:Protein of unknown function (DUF4240)